MDRGYTVVITRPANQSHNLEKALKSKGYQVLLFPTIEIKPLKLKSQHLKLLEDLLRGSYEWLVLTSANAAKVLKERVDEMGGTLPQALKIAAQGLQTAKVVEQSFGRRCDLVPKKALLEELAAALKEKLSPPSKVLVGTALKSRDILIDLLGGDVVTNLALYDTVALGPDRVATGLDTNPDRYIFSIFSPSAFLALREILPAKLLSQARFATIGPISSEAVKEGGYTVLAEAVNQSDQGFVTALDEALGF